MPKILIVDDDRTTTKLLQTLLELDGFEVSMLSRGEKALEMAQEIKPDVFLVDYHLSDMEGIDLVAALRGSPLFATTPIVMASGLNVEESALGAGANVFLFKPFEPGKLADLFNELIG
ncbi:response regulator [Aggregatilinea lenta]|uniref:response regulator n=1 Tax=Aggregatilinea lenta TaxID=913108 RepID=UPI0013C2F03F|nr:response regulator [Aggregatilinea lenta]